jgi:hypothetical protein
MELVLLKMRLVALLHKGKLEEALDMANELGEKLPDDQTVREMKE